MSAGARLLRRRSSFHLQQYRSSLRLFSPYEPSKSLSPKFTERSRVFSALADGTPEKPPKKRNGLKYAAAGAAVLALSAAAWYTTREQYAQVHHVGLPLPQVWNRQPLVQRTSSESAEVQEDEPQALKVSSVEPEVDVVGQRRQEVTKEDVDEKESLASTESGSDQKEDEGETIVEIVQTPVDAEVILVETDQASAPAEGTQPSEQGKIVHSVEGVLLVEENNVVSKEGDERRYVEHQDRENLELTEDEKESIRNRLQEEDADMFYSDEDSVDDGRRMGDMNVGETKRLQEEPVLEEVMDGGSREYGAGQNLPDRVIASFVVQEIDDDDGKRYSGSREENVSKDVDVAEISREEEPIISEEEMAQEGARVVGVDVLVGAIRTAEEMQAERDSRAFQEQLDKLQEAHKTEVKDFQAKVFAYAQERDRLEKELKKEKELAEAELKLYLHKAEENLESQLKRKDEEAGKEKEKLETLGKAQTAAAVARERAEHLENIHATQLQVNALRTAFYARSEEARVSHTAHKLAMGAFALEDAVERGHPLQKEAELLTASAGGTGGDPLVDAVVSSIPSEALTGGSWTRAQLHNTFTKLKGPMRELVLLPADGGGVFAHLLAKVTANLKISEQGSENVGDEGFEVVIGKVERYLSEGKLIEAATVLERAALGTAAERLATEWARQATNRVIIEQGLQAVQAHVISIASGLS